MTLRGAIALGALAATACGGDVFTVDVRLADRLLCEETAAPLRAVEVDVVRETGSGLEELSDLGACYELDPATNRIEDLLTPFEEAGAFAQGVPAGPKTLLRFVAYTTPRCARGAEQVCGITCPPVREGELPADGVRANFVCEGQPLLSRFYLGCVNLEQLEAEERQNICADPVAPE